VTATPEQVQALLREAGANSLLLDPEEEDFLNLMTLVTGEDPTRYSEADVTRLQEIVASISRRQTT